MPGLGPGIHALDEDGRDKRAFTPVFDRLCPAVTNEHWTDMTRGKKSPRDAAPGSGSQRQLRVGELVRHALAEMLVRGDVHDPVIESHMITIPEVRMSPDLRLATVYVMPLGGHDAEAVIDAF